MRTPKTLNPARDALVRVIGTLGSGRQVFLAWCVLLVACYVILLAGAIASFPLGAGGDFLVVYTAAEIIHGGEGQHLYDLTLQTEVQQRILQPYHAELTTRGLLPYLHPPFFAAVFVPFTSAPLRLSFYLWGLISLAILLACVTLLVRHLNGKWAADIPGAFLIALAYYPAFETLRKGQSSFVVLLAMTLTYLALKRGRDTLAGIALGSALIKPQIALVFAAILLFKKRWRAIAAFSAAAAFLTLVSWHVVGTDGLISYVRTTREVLTWDGIHHVYPQVMPNVRGTAFRLAGLLGITAQGQASDAGMTFATVAATIVFFVLILRTWRGDWKAGAIAFDLRFAQTILGSILLSPYVYWHDLSVLVLAGFLIHHSLNATSSPRCLRALLVLGHLFAIPLAAINIRATAQIVVLLMAATMLVLHRQARQEGT
jgi:hypothetical protein